MKVNEKRLEGFVETFIELYVDGCWMNECGFSSEEIEQYCQCRCQDPNWEGLPYGCFCCEALLKYLHEEETPIEN